MDVFRRSCRSLRLTQHAEEKHVQQLAGRFQLRVKFRFRLPTVIHEHILEEGFHAFQIAGDLLFIQSWTQRYLWRRHRRRDRHGHADGNGQDRRYAQQ